jgi:hypothetical protein
MLLCRTGADGFCQDRKTVLREKKALVQPHCNTKYGMVF